MPTVTINRPSGVTQDCVMVATLAFLGNDTVAATSSAFTDPAGWKTVFISDPYIADNLGGTFGIQLHMAILVAGASEPSSYTWTYTAPNNTTNLLLAGYIVAYENVDVANPQDVPATSTVDNTLTFRPYFIPPPPITTKTPNAMVLSVLLNRDSSVPFPTPPTQRFLVIDGANSLTFAGADGIAPIAGVVQRPLWPSANTFYVEATIALRPARTIWDTFAIDRRVGGASTFKPFRALNFQRHFQRGGATGPVQPPFYLTEWPVPTPETFSMQLRSFTDPLKQWLAGLDTFFGGPGIGPTYDYPNPRGKPHPSDLRTFINQLEIQLIGQDTFFGGIGQGVANLDWPVPKGKEFASSLRTFLDTLKINLIGLDFLPFRLIDWPNPFIRKRRKMSSLGLLPPAGQDTITGVPGQGPANLDWPVPKVRLPSIDLRTWTDSLKRWLIGQDLLPFRLIDWPNPRGYTPGIEMRTWIQSLVNTVLLLIIYPFNLLDWPNPRGYVPSISLKTWTDTLKMWLTGLDTFFGAAGQGVANLDWPVPKVRAPSIDLRTFTDPLKLWLSGLDVLPFSLDDWPNPIRVKDERHIRGFLDVAKIWLAGLDTFFGAPGQTIANLDWPVPRGRIPGIDLRTWVNTLRQQLIGLDFLPFSLTDWPVPKVRPPSIDLRTFTDPLKQWLAGLDVLPFNLEDWPVPKVRLPSIDLKTWLLNLQQSTLFNILAPFFLLDWPNPRGPVPGISLRTFTDPLKAWLVGLDLLPFSMDDWPVPKAKEFASSLRTFLDQMKVLLIGRDTFFGASGQTPANLDWPNPRGYVPDIELRTWIINLVDTTLVGLDKFFGAAGQAVANLDWPVPKGRVPSIDLRTWIYSVLDSTLAIVYFPFAMLDWPVPKVRTPSIDLRSWLGAMQQQLVGLDLLPFSMDDWPVPKVRLPSIDLRTWTDPLKIWLTGLDKFFGAAGQGIANLDWPVPKVRLPSIDLRTWTDPLKIWLTGLDVLPFSLGDWPNPRGYIPGIGLRTWLMDLVRSTLVAFPFSLMDWPVPKVRLPSVDLRTWIVSLVQNTLVGRDFLPFSLAEWPVPKGRIPSIDLRTWVSNLITSTYAILSFPFRLSEWPVPKGRLFPMDLRTWLVNLAGTGTFGVNATIRDWVRGIAQYLTWFRVNTFWTADKAAVDQSVAGLNGRTNYGSVLVGITDYRRT